MVRFVPSVVIYLAFATAAGAWAVPRLLAAGGGEAAVTPGAVGAAPAMSPATGYTASPEGAVTQPEPATTPAQEPPAPAAATSPTVPPPAGTVPPPPPSTARAATSVADAEIAATGVLAGLGKRYLQAVLANDAPALTAMLSARCAGVSPAAILAARRADLTAEAGTALDSVTPLNAFVAHLDVRAGEAHTVLQFVAAGNRVSFGSADGWLLEGGAWRNVECGSNP